MMELDLSWRCPLAAFAPLRATPYSLLFYGGGAERTGRYSYICAHPCFIVEDQDPQAANERLQRQARMVPNQGAEGFRAGYAGLLAYDLAQAYEAIDTQPDSLCAWPAMAMGWYDAVAVFDHDEARLTLRGEHQAAIDTLAHSLGEGRPDLGADQGRLDQVWSDERYRQAVQTAKDYIRAGDIFQVNLSHAFQGEISGKDAPYTVFQRLAGTSPAGFSAYFCLDDERVILTNTPERFLKLDASGQVEARPIKGTRPRGLTPDEDAQHKTALAQSVKDRAENLMIVDLMRNDLARVCQAGSVRVPRLYAVESFANVHHLVSTIEGQLRPDADVFDLIAACFPPGSITGAPKCRAMEIIAELEGQSRGPYCGALGWIDRSGAADFNVMIRTLSFVRQGEGWAIEARSGGAITIDSDPQAELDETHAKLAALKRAVEG